MFSSLEQQQQQEIPSNPLSLLTAEELSQLQDLSTELNDAKNMLQQTKEASDRQELNVLIEEMEEQINSAIAEIAWTKLSIRPVKQNQNQNNNNNPSDSTSVAPAAHHLMKWDDDKLYACDITSLFFEANEIRCAVQIVGFPENNRKNDGKGEIVSLEKNIVGNWDAKTAFFVNPVQNENNANNNNAVKPAAAADLATTTTIQAGSKCFAVDLRTKSIPDSLVFIPVLVERLTMHSTAWVQPILVQQQQQPNTQNQNQTSMMAVGFSDSLPAASQKAQPSFEVPLSHTRPYCLPPGQGKYLRRKWENLSQEEKNQILADKKKKQNEQDEKKRRQRTETINQQANDWQKMKMMMGGRKF
jgi:hypothetical protein